MGATPATYVEGGVDPISRVRRAAFDTNAVSALYSDLTYWAWLESSLSFERLWLWMPTDNEDGNTTATVKVYLDTASVKVALASNLSGTRTITLAPGSAPGANPDRVVDLVRMVLAYEDGWQAGLGAGPGDVEWLDGSDLEDWGVMPDAVLDPANENLALLVRPSHLALTGRAGAEAAVSCYGGADWRAGGARGFPFYLYHRAALSALYDARARHGSRSVKSRSEGNVRREYESIGDVIEVAERLAAGGIYGQVA